MTLKNQNEGTTSFRYMVSSKVIDIMRRKKITAITKSMALNFTSQYKFMKNAATKNALTSAIEMAATTSRGGGIAINLATTTVMIVSIKRAVPTAQSWPAVEI
jgi:hypothetical protein